MCTENQIPQSPILVVGSYVPGSGFARVMSHVIAGIRSVHTVHYFGVDFDGPPRLDREVQIHPGRGTPDDPFGSRKLRDLAATVRPRLVFILHDLWYQARYLAALREFRGEIKVVTYTINMKQRLSFRSRAWPPHLLATALFLSLAVIPVAASAIENGDEDGTSPAGSIPGTFTLSDAETAFRRAVFLWQETYADSDVNYKFWQFGNALDSFVRFLAVLDERKLDPNFVQEQKLVVRDMVQRGYQHFFVADQGHNIQGMWVDDFGWWGLAFLAAKDDLNSDTLSVAHECWAKINANCKSSRDSPVPGGCWNEPDFKGVQNSIVNTLYLALSVRLYRETQDGATYLPAIAQSLNWFQQWILRSGKDLGVCSATANFNGISTGLIRNSVFPVTPEQNYTWDANLPEQALLFSGLADFAAIDLPDSIPGVDSRLLKQLKGFQEVETKTLLGSLSRDWKLFFTDGGVLQVPPWAFNFSSGAQADMIIGKGPFLRYALEAEPSLLAAGTDLHREYRTTANAAWATTASYAVSPPAQMWANWVPDGTALNDFATRFNGAWHGEPDQTPPYCGNQNIALLPLATWSSYSFARYASIGTGKTQEMVAMMTQQTLGLDAMAAALSTWPPPEVSPPSSAPR